MEESTFALHDIIGLIGVAIILVAYLLLQIERIASNGLVYSLLNVIGAIFIIFSLLIEWNLSAFAMESTWLIVSVYGIVKWYNSRKPQTR